MGEPLATETGWSWRTNSREEGETQGESVVSSTAFQASDCRGSGKRKSRGGRNALCLPNCGLHPAPPSRPGLPQTQITALHGSHHSPLLAPREWICPEQQETKPDGARDAGFLLLPKTQPDWHLPRWLSQLSSTKAAVPVPLPRTEGFFSCAAPACLASVPPLVPVDPSSIPWGA